MALVSMEHVVKEYGTKSNRVRAVDSLCLNVADRELVVLVGPSGCGKTTTLRLIAGLESPDAGTIHIGDRVVNDIPPRDRDVAMVFQNYALYPHMTVYKNLAFGLKMRRVAKPDIDSKVRRVATMLGLTDLLDRRPGTLSGGQQQRVALGRAVVREPKAFLLDEPLSNLDVALRTQLRTELKSLHVRLSATIIHVTHDQEEAMTLGDRLVVMDKGVVQQCGTPLDVYTRPANRFVAGFIGRPGMSFLQGTLTADGGDVVFCGKNDLRIHLAGSRSGLGSSACPQEVWLGVRSEYVQPVFERDDAAGDNHSIPVSVSVVEPLGDRTYVHGLTAGNESLIARMTPHETVQPGDSMRFAVDPDGVHLFSVDPAGGRLEGGGLS